MNAPSRPPLLMQRLRWSLLRNGFRTLLGQSIVRPMTVVLITLLIWGLVFAGSLDGFRFLRDDVHVPLRGEILGILLDLLFLTLGTLLVFTGGLILYGSLFTAPETAFLLSTPLPDDHVFAHKFQGATAISIWAFLLLGGPLLIAYGIACYAPWYFYALLPLFFIGFILLPASLERLHLSRGRQPAAAGAEAGARRRRRARRRPPRPVDVSSSSATPSTTKETGRRSISFSAISPSAAGADACRTGRRAASRRRRAATSAGRCFSSPWSGATDFSAIC